MYIYIYDYTLLAQPNETCALLNLQCNSCVGHMVLTEVPVCRPYCPYPIVCGSDSRRLDEEVDIQHKRMAYIQRLEINSPLI